MIPGIARGILRGAVVVDGSYEVVGEARNGEGAVAICGGLHPDVVIVDVNIPPMNGGEAARIIHSEQPAKHIIAASLATQALPDLRDRGRNFSQAV